jgi:hypothetical protein
MYHLQAFLFIHVVKWIDPSFRFQGDPVERQLNHFLAHLSNPALALYNASTQAFMSAACD